MCLQTVFEWWLCKQYLIVVSIDKFFKTLHHENSITTTVHTRMCRIQDDLRVDQRLIAALEETAHRIRLNARLRDGNQQKC